MRLLGGAAAIAVMMSVAGAQAATAPLMTVTVKPAKVVDSRSDVQVTMVIPQVSAPAGAPLLSMGLFTPGLSRSAVMKDLQVTDAAGLVPLSQASTRNGPGGWSPTRPVSGQMTVRYVVVAENIPALSGGPPTALRVDGDAISGTGGTLFMSMPGVKGDYRIALDWDTSAMGPGVEAISSWGDGDVTLPAGPVARLERAIYMAGTLEREPAAKTGAFSAVWVKGQPPFDPRPPMQLTAKMHHYMSGFFKDESEPPYRVMMRFNPMNAGGGAALTHSFLITYGRNITAESFMAILGHEMTHTWTAGGMDKWYSEGNAVYYQALLPWRGGLFTTEQYLDDLNETAYRYFANALRSTPEAEVLPRFWEDTRIRVLPYDRGAMYFAVLNGKIKRASGGKRSIDDLILTMVKRDQKGENLTEAMWLELLQKELGDDGRATHRSMMAGGLMAPQSDDFGPCFRRVTKQMRQFDLGFDNGSITTNPKVIKGLKPDSEAEKAGLRNGDVVTYAVALDSVQGDINRKLELNVTRDGKTFPLSYLPRGGAVDVYQWERVPGVGEDKCKS